MRSRERAGWGSEEDPTGFSESEGVVDKSEMSGAVALSYIIRSAVYNL